MSLPEKHRNSTQMARALASYINDPMRVYKEVLSNFETSPGIRTIERYQESWRRQKNASPEKPFEGFTAEQVEQEYEKANQKFLSALWASHSDILQFARAKGRNVIIPGKAE